MTILDTVAGTFMFAGIGWDFYLEVYNALTIPGWGVIIALLLQSVYLIAIGIERQLTYSKAREQSRAYAPKVAQALKSNSLDEAIALGDKFKDSHLAMVVSSGLKEFQAHEGGSAISSDELESSKRALERAIAVKTAELKRGLAGLATVGSTAPFVGLFGTVVGIIGAFQALKTQQNAGISAVGGAISEALFATAIGILVAVPAVWIFNYFTNKVTSFGVEMENAASELVDYFIKQQRKK